ncbi:MAG: ubiquinol-cytochrome c reductase iron-sulfur subunit [Bacteroidota bacterium]
MERKEFLNKMAIGSSLLLSASFVLNACSKEEDDFPDETGNGDEITVDLNNNDFAALQTVGGFAYKGDIIVIRSGENSYLALSKICTHQSCTVSYNHDENSLPCPCHGSIFSTAGAVLNGPAESNLKVYSVKQEGNILTIS